MAEGGRERLEVERRQPGLGVAGGDALQMTGVVAGEGDENENEGLMWRSRGGEDRQSCRGREAGDPIAVRL